MSDDAAAASPEAVEFGTDGWRATLDEFTAPRVRLVGQAVADHLADAGVDGGVCVGYDARETSRGFAEELARVLAANGRDVLVPERDTPTPVVAWTVPERDLAGALQITASHNPPDYNGVKFLPSDGAPALPEVTDDIEARLAAPDPLPEESWGSVTETDLYDPYAEAVRSLLGGSDGSDSHDGSDSPDGSDGPAGPDLSGVTVAYDAMHGSGRGFTDALLEAAGAEVERLRCERDPDFGGGAPEPVAERCEALIDRVEQGDADLGVVNDGDADRLGIVTPERGFLDPNLLYAVLYDYRLESVAGDAVRTVSTSSIVDRVAAAHDQAVHETAVGFKWVAEAMAAHDVSFGGEESGGYGLSAHLRNKDGVCCALLAAAAEAAEPIDARVDRLLATHGRIVQDRVSVDCPDDRKAAVVDALADALPDAVAGSEVEAVNRVDGFKIALADGGWLLVRPSGTEPKMRIYAEGGSQDRVDALLDAGVELVAPLV
jgi:phosphomannomutase